ncbi:MAG: hypothetical protein HOP19_21780 [Acidobacteria bacterium]|nr:hypothetical protein [Acidobacteriota bacterium]
MNEDPVVRFAGGVFLLVGVLVRYLLTTTLLELDRRTGYHLYKNAPNEQVGIQRARKFYRLFGFLFAVIGALGIILANKDYLQAIFLRTPGN